MRIKIIQVFNIFLLFVDKSVASLLGDDNCVGEWFGELCDLSKLDAGRRVPLWHQRHLAIHLSKKVFINEVMNLGTLVLKSFIFKI